MTVIIEEVVKSTGEVRLRTVDQVVRELIYQFGARRAATSAFQLGTGQTAETDCFTFRIADRDLRPESIEIRLDLGKPFRMVPEAASEVLTLMSGQWETGSVEYKLTGPGVGRVLRLNVFSKETA